MNSGDRRAFLKKSAMGAALAGAALLSVEKMAQAAESARLTSYATPELVEGEARKAGTKKMLVLVDYQVDFVDGALGKNQLAVDIEKDVFKKVKEYQDNKDIVVYTMDTHPKDGYAETREGKMYKSHCVPGTPGWEIYGSVKQLITPERAAMVKKGTFGSTDLIGVIQRILHQGTNISSIEMAGVSSTACVFHNAILLYNFFPEIELRFSKIASAARSTEAHEAILKQLAGFGVVITET